MHVGLLSLRTLSNALDGSDADRFLKGAAILYSQVACWAEKSTVGALAERLGTGMSGKQLKLLRSCFVSTTALDPTLSTLDSFEVVERIAGWTKLADGIDPQVFGEMVEDFVFKQLQSPRHEVVSLYLSIQLSCPFHAHPDETQPLAKLFVRRPESLLSEQKPLSVSLPDLDTLSWADILELRRSPYLSKCRVFLSSFYLASDADKRIAEEINSALWEAVGSL